MVNFIQAFALAALVAIGNGQSCATFSTCADCIGEGSFCGWCSPAPTVYDNGTLGSQCQNQKDFGWHCNHLYSTDQCQQGYVCNATVGQCQMAPAGQGDTLANCQKTCKMTPPAPSGLSKCNVATLQCEPCKDYCKSNGDCPGSYCQNGLCHGSMCQTKVSCTEKCSGDTPDELVGTWRGLMIQAGYESGEYDLKFQKRAAGPQVSFRGPTGEVSTGSLQADSATGGREISISYTTGPLQGSNYNGAYDPWEPSKETEQSAFYFGAPGEDKPATVEAAMNGTGATVYTLSRCSPHAATCDFTSVFPGKTQARRLLRVAASTIDDPCTGYSTCSNCISAKEGTCGWCTTKVVYNDSTTGSQCAGFDSTGKPLGWKCAGVFSKSDCSDYGCDWSDIKAPKCAPCTHPGCGLSKKECADACKPPPSLYKCNNATSKCEPCANAYCTSNTDCPGSYCNIHGAGPWSCHGGVAGGCATNTSCSAACGSTETFYFCDKFSGQCKHAAAGSPGAQTKWECSHSCTKAAPTGTWRGVFVSTDFTRGEYDFTFYDDSSLHMRNPAGETFKFTIAGLNMSAGTDADMIITGTDTASGKTFYGLFHIDNLGNDGVVDFLFWGESDSTAITSFDEAMKAPNRMTVMSGCRKGSSICDFSRSEVGPKVDFIVPLVATFR